MAALVMAAGLVAPASASAQPVANPAAAIHTTGPAPNPAPTPPPAIPPPKAWALVDVDTRNVIDAGNDHVPLPPASLTKVITALAAVASIPPGAAIPISARAEAAPADKISVKQGQVWSLDELLHALLISSANDAAVALAERGGGTVEGFQSIFAATATSLGMADNPVLNDPAGLDGPEGVEGGNLASARDLAIAARALLANPALAPIVATPIYYFNGPDGIHHRLTNHNYSFLVTYPGAIGMKTGYTSRAGNCLIAAARQGGRTMLAVILNSSNPNATATQLLNEGFATLASAEPAADRLPPLPGEVPPANVPAPRPAGSTASPGPSAPAGGGRSPGPVAAPARATAAAGSRHIPWLPVALVAVLVGAVVAVVARRRAVRRRPARAHARGMRHRRAA